MAAPRRSPGSGSRHAVAAQAGAGRPAAPKPEINRAAFRKAISLLFPFVIFLILGLLLIWERVKVNELAAAVAAMEIRRNQLVEQNGKLRVQVEQLSGYARISRLATQRLGLVSLPQQIIVVEEE